MRIIFMGTGEIALPTLQWLISSQDSGWSHELVAVYTQPDKPVGRKHLL
ncbi:MAG: methionyl-tRNA formyltransferase, partial [Verrucomicrobiales bacterium]